MTSVEGAILVWLAIGVGIAGGVFIVARSAVQIASVAYKVIEKDPAHALTDDQKTKIHDSAYAYWFDKNRRVHDIRKLVPGYEFEP